MHRKADLYCIIYEGVYLLQDYTPLVLGEDRQITDQSGRRGNRDVSDTHNYFPHLLAWWRELFAISLLTVFVSIIVHVVLQKYIVKPAATTPQDKSTTSQEDKVQTTSSQQSESSTNTSNSSSSEQSEYISRFYSDFEQTAVLGRGGFGVVFESRNCIDDCTYAIKRIALNKSERAREKVMREVKALAKLDNSGIVRYYQAWFENPPPGWQESRDKFLVDMPSSTPGFSVTEMSPTPADIRELSPQFGEEGGLRRLSQLYLCNLDSKMQLNPKGANPMKGYCEVREWNGATIESKDEESWAEEKSSTASGLGIKPCGSSDTFVPHSANFEFCVDSGTSSESDSEDEGLRFSKTISGHGDGEDSFEVVFDEGTEDETTYSSQGKVPFSAYKIDSSNSVDVVFEDSGCGDKEEDLPPHSVIMMSSSSRNSQSSAPVQTMDRSKSQHKHKRSFSEDIKTTGASRPTDLPLQHKEEKPVAKLYLYIQMQLCKRESLKDWLLSSNQHREKLLCLDIFHQIVSAMDYVHDMGLMHRDLKPSNIFFSMDGIVKIGDFGLVTALEETCGSPFEAAGRVMSQRHTGQVGTKLYMSPEQNAGQHYTHKVDIYAMGLIFFELFNIFDTEMERIRTMSDAKRLRFPESFTKSLSREEIVFVKRLLSHDPDHRPSTKEILGQSMFSPFEEVQKAYQTARARSSSRIRTYSTSSNHSGSPSQSRLRGSGSESNPRTSGSDSLAVRGSSSESNAFSSSEPQQTNMRLSGNSNRGSECGSLSEDLHNSMSDFENEKSAFY